MGQVMVFSGPERRRRWSEEGRLQILAEAFSPGARVTDVCRLHDISSGLVYTWRRKLREAGAAQAHNLPDEVPAPAFAEAVMEEAALPATLGQHPTIIVDLARGRLMSIFRRGITGPGRRCAEGLAMIPPGARVWIAMGHTDMRKVCRALRCWFSRA